MNEQNAWADAIASLIEWENEIFDHNEEILKTIKHDPDDFKTLMDDGCVRITDKMQWVEKPTFKPEQKPDVFGAFTLTHIDQWTTGMEGDSYAGYMYVKVDGFDKWLKIPYDC